MGLVECENTMAGLYCCTVAFYTDRLGHSLLPPSPPSHHVVRVVLFAGTAGSKLAGKPDLYISRDGGVTWQLVCVCVCVGVCVYRFPFLSPFTSPPLPSPPLPSPSLQTLEKAWGVNLMDYGGVIVAAKDYTQEPSHVIKYTCQEGLPAQWQEYTFLNRDITVWGVVTEPGENTVMSL